MSSPEHREFGVPVDKTGGVSSGPSSLESLPPNPLPDVPQIRQIFPSLPVFSASDLRKVRREYWEKTGCVPSVVGGQEIKKSASSPDQSEGQDLNQPDLSGEKIQDVPFVSEQNRRNLLVRSESKIIGKADFHWKRELSEQGKKLYLLLLKEMGDIELLPQHAAEDQFDLNAALDELRRHGLLDESNPASVKLISRKL